MPIFRYFMLVGGALLALLFAADFVWPAAPTEQVVGSASYDQPLIRIRSDRHLPDRVVIDTSQPTIAAPTVKTADAAPRPPGPVDVLAEMSAKARVRDTFAQFTPAGAKVDTASAKKADTRSPGQAQMAQTQVPPVQAQPKRRVARARPAPQRGQPMMLVAQQPHFGLFNTTW